MFLLPGNKELFCSDRKKKCLWGGISAPLCAKAENNKVRESETFEETVNDSWRSHWHGKPLRDATSQKGKVIRILHT